LGTRPTDALHPDDLQKLVDTICKATRDPGWYGPVVARYRHKDGSWRWIEGVASSNMLEHPDFGGIVYYGRDVTERVRAQEKERFLSLLVENSLDLMLVADAEGNARYANPANERILGYGREEFMGMNVPGLLHPDDQQQVMDMFAEAVANPGVLCPKPSPRAVTGAKTVRGSGSRGQRSICWKIRSFVGSSAVAGTSPSAKSSKRDCGSSRCSSKTPRMLLRWWIPKARYATRAPP
jgi:hypothetical protein